MPGEQTDIELLISAKDQASQALKKISAEATRVGRELDKAKAKLEKTGQGADDVDRLQTEFRRLNGEVKKYNTALGQTTRAQKKVERSGSDLRRTLAGIGFAELTRQAVLNAAAVQDASSASVAIMGDSAKAVEAFAKSAADSYGLSNRAALEASTNFAMLGKAAGLSGDQLAQFGIQLTERAADLRSFKGGSMQEAIDALQSGLNGEAEPLRKYGIFLDDARLRQAALKLGIVDTTKQALTPQQRILAATTEIFAQNTDSIGDNAKTWDSAANTIQRSQARYEDLSATIGESLLPAVVEVLRPVGTLVSAINAMPDGTLSAALAMGAMSLAVRKIGPELAVARTQMAATAAQAGLMRGAVAGASSMLGGPWGIALTAGIGLLTLFSSRSDEATQSQTDYGRQLGETTEAMRLRNAQTVAQTLADEGALKEAEELGVSTGRIIRAVLDEGDARDKLRTQLDTLTSSYDSLFAQRQMGLQVSNKEIDQARDQKVAAQALAASVAEQNSRFDQTTDAADAAGLALDKVGAGAEDARTGIERLTDSMDPLISTLDRISGRAELAASFRDARAAVADFAKNVDVGANGMRRLNTGTERGKETFEALVDPIRTAYDETKRLVEADQMTPARAQAKLEAVTRNVIDLARQADLGGDAINKIRRELDALRDKKITLTLATVRLHQSSFDSKLDGLAAGDTSRPHGVDMPGGAVGAFHAALAGSLPGTQTVTSGIRDWGLGSSDSDHRFGRAYDLVGSNLDAYRSRVQAAGGFAEYHGTGRARHLHVVPFTGRSSGHGDGPLIGQVQINNPAAGVDVQAELHRFTRTQARINERRAKRG